MDKLLFNPVVMDKLQFEPIISDTLSHLKDFQLKTVETIYNKLYVDGEKKHLVADEVGLGKTIVAKGLIAKVLKDHLTKKEGNPFKVFYICSNQALAAQNLRKLNILKGTDESTINVGRLIFQAFKDYNTSAFRLTSLTPSTSFRLIRGSGIQEERLLIYTILSKYKVYTKGRRDNGLKLALMGFVESPDHWKLKCDEYKKNNNEDIRSPIFRKFKDAVNNQIVPKSFTYVYKELKLTKPTSLQTVLIKYSELFKVNNVKSYHGRNEILSLLRRLITEICLDYMNADLYILDEFQRFKDLIDTEGKEFKDLSEAAAIAKKIFEKTGAKVLMLSATPFKQYSTRQEDENEDDHFKEFRMVLNFLLKNNEDLEIFTQNRKKFFELLRRPESIAFNDRVKFNEQLLPKYELERLYRKVISRTERLIVSDDKNTLVRNSENNTDELLLKPEDINDFLNADIVLKAINENTSFRTRNIVNYVLSCPFPFSYLDKYKVKEILKENKSNPHIKSTIVISKQGWVDWNKIQYYKELKYLPNGKLRYLIKETMANELWKQLWIAPSLPYYELEGSFKNSKLASKTLLFSKWVMVPKMVASLLSYDAERLTIGDKRILTKNEEPNIYTPPMGTTKRLPRKPSKILALQMKNEKPGKMSAFSLLYPSITFSRRKEFNLIENAKSENPKSLYEINKTIKTHIQKLIDDANLEKYSTKKAITRNWYWAALILLDKEYFREETEECLNFVDWNSSLFIRNKGASIEGEEIESIQLGASGKHFSELKKLFYDSENYGLGGLPNNLADVLTDIALGSPAINFARTVNHYFPNENITNRFVKSLDVASEFHSLFDKPEAISVIQLGEILNKKRRKVKKRAFWRDVLRYCIDGNLQAVLDEYGHLIFGDYKDLDSFFNRFYNTININTTNVKVDSTESFLNDENKVMRCHFAVDFGNQDMDKEGGRKRIANVLDNFNSPFRPFVLASTSVGQEGLDFHYYCRKLVHWNLPSNPIDFEQREGRINRFKGLVIRQNVSKKYRHTLNENVPDIWNHLFKVARETEGEGENPKPELVPFWHVEGDDINIERIVPVLPYSKEITKLKHLLATLTLYRLTFGQPRQEELVDSIFKGLTEEQIEIVRENFMINLSPISYLN